MAGKLTERLRFAQAITPQDIASADVTSDYISVDNYRRVLAIVNVAEIKAAKEVSLTLKQATADDGTDAKTLGDSVTLIAGDQAEPLFGTLEVQVAAMDEGFGYVAVTVGSNDDSATKPIGCAALILADGRYSE